MLLEEISNIKSEKKDLRNFGLVIGIALAILAGLLWWKGKDTHTVFISISVVFILLGLLLPSVLKPLHKVWMTFAVILGWFMTRVILSLLFYIVFTAIGLSLKLFGKQLLNLKAGGLQESYWDRRPHKDFNKQDYEKQF